MMKAIIKSVMQFFGINSDRVLTIEGAKYRIIDGNLVRKGVRS